MISAANRHYVMKYRMYGMHTTTCFTGKLLAQVHGMIPLRSYSQHVYPCFSSFCRSVNFRVQTEA